MTRLNDQQRAARRATRKNKKIKRNYPLFYQAGIIEDWMTDEMKEMIFIQEQSAAMEEREEERYKRNKDNLNRAERYRKIAIEAGVDMEVIKNRDAHFVDWQKQNDGSYKCDVWFNVIREWIKPRPECSWADIARYMATQSPRKEF